MDNNGVELVFVIVAELTLNAFAVIARDNHYDQHAPPRSILDVPRRSAFMSYIDEELSIATQEPARTVALKPEGYAVWFQFTFKHNVEYWGFLSAMTHVRTLQVTRREVVEQRWIRLREHFFDFFQPKVPPYNDHKELDCIHVKEEELQGGAEFEVSDTMDDASSDVVFVK